MFSRYGGVIMVDEKNTTVSGKTDDEGLFALIAYFIGVFAIILIFLKKDSKFVKFHAIQSTLLTIILSVISFITFGFGVWIMIPVWLYVLYLGYTKAYVKKEMFHLPLIGDYAEKFTNDIKV